MFSVGDIVQLIKTFDDSNGWLIHYLGYVFAIVFSVTALIYIYKFWTGKINIWGRSKQKCLAESIFKQQIASLEKDKIILEEQIRVGDFERKRILNDNAKLESEIENIEATSLKHYEQCRQLKDLFEELDAKYADETYVKSQLMYALDEVSHSIANIDDFNTNRADVYKNLLDYLVNMMADFREKSPRVIIFIPDENDETKLKHYTHSSGYSHSVSKYQPLINHSAAGKAWRTNKPFYIPNLASRHAEFDYGKRKPLDVRNHTIFCVPIKAGSDPCFKLGVLCMTGIPENAYTQTEIERILLFTSIIYPLMYVDVKIKGIC